MPRTTKRSSTSSAWTTIEARRDLDRRRRLGIRGQASAGGDRPGRRFDATDSVTVCAFTTDPTDAPLFRIHIEPDEINGLRESCRLMVDKITTVPRSKLGERIGRLSDEQMVALGRALLVFIGLAG